MSPIAFLSDFGLSDSYVGVIKSVIYQIDPGIRVIDICHEIPPQNIKSAMYVLRTAFDYFPAGTVCMAVVDPEVGTSRKPVVMHFGNKYIICPNNGIASMVAAEYEVTGAWEIKLQLLTRGPVSKTFHGRDVFAPAAALLSKTQNPNLLGVPIDPGELELGLFVPASEHPRGIFSADIIHIDRFGNLITTLKSDRLKNENLPEAEVIVNGQMIRGIKETYADVEIGENLAYFGSSAYLEIGVRNGNAARRLIPNGEADKVSIVVRH